MAVLFIGLSFEGVDDGGGADMATTATASVALSLDLLQGSFSLLQSIVASHGGVIKELSVDDKGTVSGLLGEARVRVSRVFVASAPSDGCGEDTDRGECGPMPEVVRCTLSAVTEYPPRSPI